MVAEESDGTVTAGADALTALLAHRWPGNLRELRNVVRTAVALCDAGIIRAADLPDALASPPPEGLQGGRGGALETAERTALDEALAAHQGNVSLTARSLGVSRTTLYRKLRRHGIRPRGAE